MIKIIGWFVLFILVFTALAIMGMIKVMGDLDE